MLNIQHIEWPFSLFYQSGSHLLSHTVSSIVPSADQVLTIVFGMCTGVTPDRIATRSIEHLVKFFEPSVKAHLFTQRGILELSENGVSFLVKRRYLFVTRTHFVSLSYLLDN